MKQGREEATLEEANTPDKMKLKNEEEAIVFESAPEDDGDPEDDVEARRDIEKERRSSHWEVNTERYGRGKRKPKLKNDGQSHERKSGASFQPSRLKQQTPSFRTASAPPKNNPPLRREDDSMRLQPPETADDNLPNLIALDDTSSSDDDESSSVTVSAFSHHSSSEIVVLVPSV